MWGCAEAAAMAIANHTTRDTWQRNTPKVATSPCRFLPLLPPITPNVKSSIPANPLEFGIREEATPDTKSKSGKNGNVDHPSQLYPPATLSPTDVGRFCGAAPRRDFNRPPALPTRHALPCGKLQGGAAPAPTHKSATSQTLRQRIGGTMMDFWDAFYGPNAGYAQELYERYLRDPNAVDPATRAIFAQLASPDAVASAAPAMPVATPPAATTMTTATLPALDPLKVVAAARLARGIREYGHLAAAIDPLGSPAPGDPMLDPVTHGLSDADLAALPASIVWPNTGPDVGTCRDAIQRLRAIYSAPLGYDFDHVQDFTERDWLRDVVESGAYSQPLPADERRALLDRLTEVEEFEHFLHTTFQGQKRFSIEGLDMLVPMLDELIHDAAAAGAREVLIGMAHLGRLSVLAHVLGKPYTAIFSEFHTAPNKELVPSEGSNGINYGWTGDVKYHLGARRLVREGQLARIQLTLAHNPSHLEFVNPVVEGFARAAQERRERAGPPQRDVDVALPVLIHGDAAFPGEGVVPETLNLSRLPGYTTGGTVHIIANNQIGFTTGAGAGRSTLYASDLAKGFEIPIIHVNGDDPAACLAAIRIAHAYRQRYHQDFLIDLVGY